MNTDQPIAAISARSAFFFAFLWVVIPPGRAQKAATDPAGNPTGEQAANEQQQIVRMSQFEVTTTQGTGYVSNNAARGFKSDQPLLDIPQADIVMTNDMIRDIAEDNTSNMLSYLGVAAVYEGEPVSLRGTRDANPYIDDMPDPSQGHEDTCYIDSYEIIKGPAQVLYANAALSGVVIKSTKKALDFDQDIISESYSQWGVSRTLFDFNHPLGELGGVKIAFRVVGAVENGNTYWTNLINRSEAVHPSLGLEYHSTTIRAAYDFEHFYLPTQNLSLITPSGKLWTGWGRRTDGYAPGDDDVNDERISGRVEWLQKISEDWENRLEAMGETLRWYGSVVLPKGSVNWPALTETYYSLLEIDPVNSWVISDDATGKYKIGPIPTQSTFGFNTTDTVTFSEAWQTAPFGTANIVTVPINTPAGINAVAVPPPSAFSVPANPGTRTKAIYENIYLQEQFDAIPNWLSLVGGFTWAQIETISDTNIAANSPSYPSADQTGSQWLHRAGAILHLGKEAALYALTSTTFSPGTGPTYTNGRLPNVLGQGNEVGLKTAFLDGRISSTVSIYHASLSNQAVVATGGQNIAGVTYYIPIGSTTSQGVDGDLELSLVPGLQAIGTVYVGSVRDQTGNEAINATYDNAWSFYMRYDFAAGPLKDQPFWDGLALGGGLSRIGSFWQATGGFIVAPGYTLPNPVKMHEGTPIELFAVEKFAKHWSVRLGVINLLNQAWVVAGQTPYKVDPSAPRTLSLSLTYKR